MVIQKNGMVVPIEVKGGNIGVDEDGIITLPLYMVAFI